MGRGSVAIVLAVVVGAPVAATALAADHDNSKGSTDELRLTTKKRHASTGVFATEVFNARYKNGQLKPLKHSKIVFPKGTRFDPLGSYPCSASDADFKSEGMSACPQRSKIGYGNATVRTTGTAVESPDAELDVTAFDTKYGSLMVFSRNGAYLSSEPIYAHGHSQDTSPKPSCVPPTDQPPCPHGRITPRSLTITYPATSRRVHGKRHNLVTTPRRCPKSGHWRFYDKHTFEDNSYDLFVNHPACLRKKHRRHHKNDHR